MTKRRKRVYELKPKLEELEKELENAKKNYNSFSYGMLLGKIQTLKYVLGYIEDM